MKWTKMYDENTIVNMKLSKMIGLYQILDPNSPQILGYNIFHVIFTFFISYEVVMSMFCLIGIYYWINNISQIIFQLTYFVNFSFVMYKIVVLIRNGDNMRKCIEVACNDFIKYKHKENKVIFSKSRFKSLILTYAYVLIGQLILFAWFSTPLIFNNNYITLKSLNGKLYSYHLNVFNVFFPVSSAIYNQYFILFYIFEVFCGLLNGSFSFIFDSLLISMCIAISSNLKTIGNMYATLGQKYKTNCEHNFEVMKNSKNNLLIISDLKIIIKDHQNVLATMDNFYNHVRPIILGQIIVASQTIVCLLFIITLNLYGGRIEDSIQTTKLCFVVPFYMVELYLTCYLFGGINTEKDLIGFAMYCSNWEDMDIECKKLILLAMKMNNAHKLCMKITQTKIVNMEMFAHTINLCHSILSVMVNTNIKKSKT